LTRKQKAEGSKHIRKTASPDGSETFTSVYPSNNFLN